MSRLRRGGRAVGTVRTTLLHRDGNVCRRCDYQIDMSLSGNHPLGATVGHIIPVSLGGTDELENLCLEHGRCNKGAGNREYPRATLAEAHRIVAVVTRITTS